jgi:hypothetical protein
LAAICVGGLLFGRARNGSLVGTVKDVSSTVVQNASLELMEVNTGTEGSAATTDAGNHAFAYLSPGVYPLTVENTSIKKITYCCRKFIPK